MRLTGRFLRSTGQVTGGEGQSKWLIVPCDCDLCTKPSRDSLFVAVNELADQSYYQDLPPEQRPKWRHINAANLEVIGAPPKAKDYP